MSNRGLHDFSSSCFSSILWKAFFWESLFWKSIFVETHFVESRRNKSYTHLFSGSILLINQLHLWLIGRHWYIRTLHCNRFNELIVTMLIGFSAGVIIIILNIKKFTNTNCFFSYTYISNFSFTIIEYISYSVSWRKNC